MGLKATVSAEELGELDESVRSFYSEGDDGETYVLDVEGADNLPDVTNLRTAHQKTKDRSRELRDTLGKVKDRFGPLLDNDDLDLSTADPERVKEMLPFLTGEKELPKPGEGGGGEITEQQREKIRSNAIKPFEQKLDNVSKERDFWRGTAEDKIINTELRSQFARAGVKDEDFLDLLVERYRRRCELEVGDNEISVIVRDTEYGDVDPKEFVREWQETDYAKKFTDAGGNSGGGAGGGTSRGGKGLKNPWSPDNWSMTEQARILKENPERARQMAAAYGKKIRS